MEITWEQQGEYVFPDREGFGIDIFNCTTQFDRLRLPDLEPENYGGDRQPFELFGDRNQ